jgi:hypothetical protein
MSFIDTFNIAFVVSIFIVQHYLQFPFLKWRRSAFISKLPISVLSRRPSQMNAPSPGAKNQYRRARTPMSPSVDHFSTRPFEPLFLPSLFNGRVRRVLSGKVIRQGDKIIIHPPWIVSVWQHRNISLSDYLGNS